MIEKIIVVFGPPGAGKTHKIDNDPELSKLKRFDVSEYGKDKHWAVRHTLMHCDIVKHHLSSPDPETVVVEGVFAKDSPSRDALVAVAEFIGAQIVGRLVMRPFRDCQDGCGDDPERLRILNAVWPSFAPYLKGGAK